MGDVSNSGKIMKVFKAIWLMHLAISSQSIICCENKNEAICKISILPSTKRNATDQERCKIQSALEKVCDQVERSVVISSCIKYDKCKIYNNNGSKEITRHFLVEGRCGEANFLITLDDDWQPTDLVPMLAGVLVLKKNK